MAGVSESNHWLLWGAGALEQFWSIVLATHGLAKQPSRPICRALHRMKSGSLPDIWPTLSVYQCRLRYHAASSQPCISPTSLQNSPSRRNHQGRAKPTVLWRQMRAACFFERNLVQVNLCEASTTSLSALFQSIQTCHDAYDLKVFCLDRPAVCKDQRDLNVWNGTAPQHWHNHRPPRTTLTSGWLAGWQVGCSGLYMRIIPREGNGGCIY